MAEQKKPIDHSQHAHHAGHEAHPQGQEHEPHENTAHLQHAEKPHGKVNIYEGHDPLTKAHDHHVHAETREDPGDRAEHAMHHHMAHEGAGRDSKAAMLMEEAEGAAHDMTHTGHDMAHAGHGAHVDHTGHEDLFRRKFWVSLILSIPVLLYSEGLQSLLGFTMPDLPGALASLTPWIAPLFSVIVFVYGGLPFLQMAVPEIQNRRPGMMTLISLAITVAFVYSAAALFLPGAMDFFWELVTLIDIMLLGHWIEMRSVRQASGALNALAKLMPDTAEKILSGGEVQTVPVSQLHAGDRVLVRPGASVPADGEVVEGDSSVNESMITGESKPVSKHPGDQVIAGSINGDGSLRVRVTATGEETALAGIMRLVEQAQQSKSRTQVLADRAAGWLFYIALGMAALTAIAWIVAVGFNVEVIERVATVLVIACPHALGLAIPLVVAISTTMGANNGILIRDRLQMEAARDLDMVIFDKTGTLTEGRFGVVGIETVDGLPQEDVLALAAAVEGDSEHTIAQGIRRAVQEKKLTLPEVSDFEAIKGRGIRARSQGQDIYVGGPRLLEMLSLSLPEKLSAFEQSASARGQSVVHLVRDGKAVASFALADVIRPESRQAVDRLHEMGVEVAMLTGDSQPVAKAVAEELGIDTYFAEVLPEHKDSKVIELQKQGKRVAMVGDGINDAPALTRADVGVAIGSGTDVAVESAGIILVRNNPLDVVKIIELSRASYRKMRQNLGWAAGYNVIALPLAAGVLAPWGILLSPAVGALLMSISTIVVAINAQLLRRVKL